MHEKKDQASHLFGAFLVLYNKFLAIHVSYLPPEGKKKVSLLNKGE